MWKLKTHSLARRAWIRRVGPAVLRQGQAPPLRKTLAHAGHATGLAGLGREAAVAIDADPEAAAGFVVALKHAAVGNVQSHKVLVVLIADVVAAAAATPRGVISTCLLAAVESHRTAPLQVRLS